MDQQETLHLFVVVFSLLGLYIYIKQWLENQYSDDYHNDV